MISLWALAFACLLTIMGCVLTSTAATIRVPDDQPSIQAGIKAASPGDTVLVRCGSYFEHSITMRPSITLRSETGEPSCATVDAQELGTVLYCPAGIGPDTRIEGLTFTRGDGWTGGMRCESASPTVTNCAFVSNRGATHLIGVGGVSLVESRATFSYCVFYDNAGGGRLSGAGAIAASDCPSLTIANCSFFLNRSDLGSTLAAAYSFVTLRNCIIAGGDGDPVMCDDFSTVLLECCDVHGNRYGNWVGCIADQAALRGNFSLDPLFCDAPNGDLTLSVSSPCAPERSPAGCYLIGALPVGCGPQALEAMTWGYLKARFR